MQTYFQTLSIHMVLLVLLLLLIGTDAGLLPKQTMTTVRARPRTKAVVAIKNHFKCLPIDSLTISVGVVSLHSDYGLSPKLTLDVIQDQWCDTVEPQGRRTVYMPLQNRTGIPSLSQEIILTGGSYAYNVVRLTNLRWRQPVCMVIRPVGHELSSIVSNEAWDVEMNVSIVASTNTICLMLIWITNVVLPLALAAFVLSLVPSGVMWIYGRLKKKAAPGADGNAVAGKQAVQTAVPNTQLDSTSYHDSVYDDSSSTTSLSDDCNEDDDDDSSWGSSSTLQDADDDMHSPVHDFRSFADHCQDQISGEYVSIAGHGDGAALFPNDESSIQS